VEPALSDNASLPNNNSFLKEEVISIVRKVILSRPIYLDTETTGLEKQDEIVEISILDYDGSILFQSLVKPIGQIPDSATRIHGISNAEVKNSPSWPLNWIKIRNLLFGRVIAAYNAPFDMRLMQQTHNKYRLNWRESFEWLDVMALFSRYRGIWDPYRKSMRLFSLEDAGNFFKINLPNAHRSSADALLTRAVLHSMADEPY
jgi:DNA polymerase III subunit epsilon